MAKPSATTRRCYTHRRWYGPLRLQPRRCIMTSHRVSSASHALSAFVVILICTSAAAQANFKVLYNFKGGTDGGPLSGALVIDGKGNLYGTAGGGPHSYWCDGSCGKVYELAPNGEGRWTETVLHDFRYSKTDGYWPFGGVILDGAGVLYGTTGSGGTHNDGTVYQLKRELAAGRKQSCTILAATQMTPVLRARACFASRTGIFTAWRDTRTNSRMAPTVTGMSVCCTVLRWALRMETTQSARWFPIKPGTSTARRSLAEFILPTAVRVATAAARSLSLNGNRAADGRKRYCTGSHSSRMTASFPLQDW